MAQWCVARKQTTYHGNVLSDLWYGTELNPRMCGFDFKFFGYRPLIMGWAFLILAIAHHQFRFPSPLHFLSSSSRTSELVGLSDRGIVLLDAQI